MSPDIKESCEFRLLVCRLGFRAPPVRCHVDPIQQDKIGSSLRWVGAKKRKKRYEAAAATKLESEVTGESRVLRLARRARTGWTDSQTRTEFCVSATKRCDDRPRNRDSARYGSFVCVVIHKVKSRLKVTFLFSGPFFHFAKCIHRNSGWVNFNRQLPSILLPDIQILFFYSWNWFVSKSKITYWTQVQWIELMAGHDSEPADGPVALRRYPNMEPIQKKKKKPWKHQQNNHIPAACHITVTTLHWTWWVFFCDFVPLPF